MHAQPRPESALPQRLFSPTSAPNVLLFEGTVARGQLHEDAYFYTGKTGSTPGDYMPFPVTKEVLERGRERFNIYCSPCHSRIGDGNGFIPARGFSPASRRRFTSNACRKRSFMGYFYDVVTNGFGIMPDYASQIPPLDRWRIVAYIRALQLSQNATRADVPCRTNRALGAAEVPRPTRIRRNSAGYRFQKPVRTLRNTNERRYHSKTRFDGASDRQKNIAAFLLVIGLDLCRFSNRVLAFLRPDEFFRAYLLGFMCWLGVALGSMAILMIRHLTGGGWGTVIRRILGAAMRTLPLLAVLFIPVIFGIRHLYVWAQPLANIEDKHLREHLEQITQTYLTVNGFIIRAIFYFAVWNVLSFLLSKWSKETDRPANAP